MDHNLDFEKGTKITPHKHDVFMVKTNFSQKSMSHQCEYIVENWVNLIGYWLPMTTKLPVSR